MANYNNLASLSGLQVGDVVDYNTQTTIDFKKYKVRIELDGIGPSSSKPGGLTQFDLDTKNLPSQTLTYTPLYGTSLCYGSSADKFYRIAVAGNAGYGNTSAATSICGQGGGSTGQSGSSAQTSLGNYTAGGGGGGTQTSGGSGGSVPSSSSVTKTAGTAGAFGRNTKTQVISGIDYYDYEMAGWYSGGTGGYCSYSNKSATGGNGGGSGFVVGNSTTTYPFGYMGNNSTLISTIVSNISNYSLTQGGSTRYVTAGTSFPSAGNMKVTILELPPVTGPKYYNGSAWVQTTVKRYNGSAWEDVTMKYYDGSSWQ